MAERTPCLRRCSTIRVASPNQEGVERTDWEEVWMITDPSTILFIGASLMEVVLFFLIKEAHFYLCSLQVTSRCASRGQHEQAGAALFLHRAILELFPRLVAVPAYLRPPPPACPHTSESPHFLSTFTRVSPC